ncbi:hypothetical protein QK900_08645 [Arsenicicoccus dermatophilus]|uniref:hypothetical protein n=1 Tax=Arsenicicoccus dermatophilus TaxID=1076331 RepID=UPI003892828A
MLPTPPARRAAGALAGVAALAALAVAVSGCATSAATSTTQGMAPPAQAGRTAAVTPCRSPRPRPAPR